MLMSLKSANMGVCKHSSSSGIDNLMAMFLMAPTTELHKVLKLEDLVKAVISNLKIPLLNGVQSLQSCYYTCSSISQLGDFDCAANYVFDIVPP